MPAAIKFSEVVDAAERLSLDEQEALIDLLRRRTIDTRREGLARDAEEAYREFQAGKCKPATIDEIMREIRS
jgi:hypothetical protein